MTTARTETALSDDVGIAAALHEACLAARDAVFEELQKAAHGLDRSARQKVVVSIEVAARLSDGQHRRRA